MLDLTLVGNLKKEFVKAHPNVIREYERLRSDSNARIDKGSDSSQKLITLLNIRSVCKHVADFFADKRLNRSPIICFTETQKSENVHIPFPNFVSDSYMIVRHDSSDKFKSLLALYNKNYFECIHSETCNWSMSLVLKSKVSKTEISLLLVYRKIAMEEEHFSNTLRYLIISTKPNIVLGDFSFNYQNDLLISSLMQRFNFEQLVGEPIHIRGGLIDQVYVSKDFSVFSHLKAQLLSVYYSDHDSIEVTTDKLV